MSLNCFRNKAAVCSNVLFRSRHCMISKQKLQHSLKKNYHGKIATPPNKYIAIYRDFHGHIQDNDAAKDFLVAIDAKERALLLQSLLQFEGNEQDSAEVIKPSKEQLRLVLLHNALPFIGFGFLDNFMMIVAGEYIDTMFGAMLGISTMAAAGLGNLISDVCGVGSASYVETITAKVGVKAPPLSPQQVLMKRTRRYSNWGKMIGVSLGCLIGMCPLLFFQNYKREECEEPHGKPEMERESGSTDTSKTDKTGT